jgi:site-specific DNA-adenine methylase
MPDALDWLPTAVAVVVFLGAAAVYLRGSRDKGTIATLTANNAALTERVNILEQDKSKLQNEVGSLKQAVTVLEGVANSSDAIASLRIEMSNAAQALVSSLDDHHTQAMTGLNTIHSDLQALKGKS